MKACSRAELLAVGPVPAHVSYISMSPALAASLDALRRPTIDAPGPPRIATCHETHRRLLIDVLQDGRNLRLIHLAVAAICCLVGPVGTALGLAAIQPALWPQSCHPTPGWFLSGCGSQPDCCRRSTANDHRFVPAAHVGNAVVVTLRHADVTAELTCSAFDRAEDLVGLLKREGAEIFGHADPEQVVGVGHLFGALVDLTQSRADILLGVGCASATPELPAAWKSACRRADTGR